MNYGSGIHQVGGGATRIQSCNGVPTNSYALGGESKTINNPGGWQTLAANLQDHIGRYIEIKFVLSREDNPTGDVSPEEPVMPGWVIDNLRIGPTLPQSASITVRTSVQDWIRHPPHLRMDSVCWPSKLRPRRPTR